MRNPATSSAAASHGARTPHADERDAIVCLEGVSLSFGNRAVLENASCAFARNSISVVLGGSGAGKSTTLRLIGGLIHPQAGRIAIDGEDIVPLSETELTRVRKKIGMMFQGGALLNSMTVFENLALPLREQTNWSEAEIAEQVAEQLESVGLGDAGELMPSQLSGGMVKRASLARALVRTPQIVLCDEPFSGLDPLSVLRIEKHLMKIQRERKITMIVTSHHISSTLRMADQVVFLLDKTAISDRPQAIIHHPDPRISAFFQDQLPEWFLEENQVGAIP